MTETTFVRQTFTDKQSQALLRVADIHLTFVERLKSIYQEDAAGTKRILLIDYQEIAGYSRPLVKPNINTGEWLDYVSFSFLLENAAKDSIVVPEGSFFELLIAIQKVADEIELGPALLDNLIRLERATDYSFRGLFEHSRLIDFNAELQIGMPTKDLALLVLNGLAQNSSVARRLEHFFNKDVVVNPSEVLTGSPSSKEVASVFRFIYNHLKSSRRSSRYKQANFADALNFAWTYYANNAFQKPQTFLVTHTKALRAASRAFLSNNPDSSNFLWSPATAVYDAILEEASQGRKLEWLLQVEEVCSNMKRAIEESFNSPSFSSSYSQDLDFVFSLSNSEIKKYLSPFDKYALGPLVKLFSKFEAVYRENLVEAEDKLFSNPRLQKALLNGDMVLGGEQGRELERAKCRVRTILKATEIRNATEFGLLDFYKVKKISPADDIVSVRLAKKSLNKTFNIFIDNYSNFSAVYWKTTLSLSRVVSILNDLLRKAEIAGNTVMDKRVSANVYRQGVIAYMLTQTVKAIQTNRVTSPLTEIPVDLNKCFKLADNQKIDFVRINTQLADFCYYSGRHLTVGASLYPERARVVGLFIKTKMPALVSDFYSLTSTESVKAEWIKDFVAQNYYAKRK